MEEFDVVVVGGGPGGATVATLVALQGHRTLLLEKEHFPRYQIGESLLPSTVHGICRLGSRPYVVRWTGATTCSTRANNCYLRASQYLWAAVVLKLPRRCARWMAT